MRLWTTTVEYGASGEGETLIAWIGYAKNAAQAKAGLVGIYGKFHGAFGLPIERVARNNVTELLFSDEMLKTLERLEGKAKVRAHAMLPVNRA